MKQSGESADTSTGLSGEYGASEWLGTLADIRPLITHEKDFLVGYKPPGYLVQSEPQSKLVAKQRIRSNPTLASNASQQDMLQGKPSTNITSRTIAGDACYDGLVTAPSTYMDGGYVRLVHQLDRPTSELLVVAKAPWTTKTLSRAYRALRIWINELGQSAIGLKIVRLQREFCSSLRTAQYKRLPEKESG